MRKRLISLGCCLLSSLTAFPGESPGEAKNIYGVLIQGILDGDRSVFEDVGTEQFRKQMTPELFQTAQIQIGDRLRQGFQSVYLGKVVKNSREIYLWKILILQSSDELLATLILEKNKVGGFYFQ
jgi:hypothetical protein